MAQAGGEVSIDIHGTFVILKKKRKEKYKIKVEKNR